MKKMNWLWIVPFLSLHLFFTTLSTNSHPPEIRPPAPSPWPEQFHALLYMNLSKGQLQISDLWYDWPRGRNVNLMQKQLGVLLYDVEWNNGTSFYYTVGEDATCSVMEFGVGIPRRNFLDGAVYLGTAATDGFLCNVWEKIDFIWYYEDVETKVPVRWDFYDGISTHVITFEVGATLDDSVTQAPSYCFADVGNQRKTELKHRRNSKIGDFLHPRS